MIWEALVQPAHIYSYIHVSLLLNIKTIKRGVTEMNLEKSNSHQNDQVPRQLADFV